MADEVIGGVAVQITGDATQLQQTFGSVQKTAEDAGQKVSQAFNAGAEGSHELESSLEGVQEKLIELAGEFFALEKIADTFKEAISVDAEIQKTRIALTALTGSASAANDVVEQMERLAKSEAISFPELLPAAQRMAAMGISTEQLTPAMAAAGNAAFALGDSIENVSTRMASIALSGMAMPRQLRTIGLSAKDLAATLGITEQELEGVFKDLPDEDRIAALISAMDKFKDAAKLPAGISGGIIEFKNAWHGVLAEIGQGIEPVTDKLLRFAAVDAEVLAMLLKIGQHKPKEFDLSSVAIPEGQTGLLGDAKAKFDAQAEAAKLHAKEMSGNTLAQLDNEQKANEAAAELARTNAETQIAADHAIRQANIDGQQDEGTRNEESAQEAIRVEQDKASQIGAIDEKLRRQQVSVAQRRLAPELAGAYEPNQNPNEAAAKAAEIQTRITGQVQAINQRAANEQAKLAQSVSEARGKAGEADVDAQRGWAREESEAWEKNFNARMKQMQAEFVEEDRLAELHARVAEIETKGAGDVAALEIQRQKIDLERVYGLETSHTAAEQIAQARALATFDAEERAQKLASAEAQLKEAEAAAGTLHDQTRIASLTADIAVLKQQNANADAASASAIDQQNQKLTQQLTLEQQIAAAKNAAAGTYQQQQRAIGTNLGNEIGALPQQVGNDLGNSISDALLGHHPGKSIGQEMAKSVEDSLKNTAKKLVGDLLSAGFQEIFGKIKNAISPPAAQTGGAVGAPTGGGGVTAGATIPAGLPGAGVPIYGTPGAGGASDIALLTQINASLRQLVQAESACQCSQGTNQILNNMMGANASWKSDQIGKLSSIQTSSQITALSTVILATIAVVNEIRSFFPLGGGATAGGTDSAPGGMTLVGEKGPEIVNLPRGSQVIPNHAIRKYADGTSYSSTAFQTGSTNLHFHAHGMSNPDQFIDHVMRKLPDKLKARSPQFSPYSK